MNQIKAQEYLEKNWTDKSIKAIAFAGFSDKEKLNKELIIQDYSDLEEINLSNHELTSLTIINCPQLQRIRAWNNQLTKLEISDSNQITELMVGKNELTTLDLTNCPKITRLIVFDNPLLSEIKGLNLTQIKEININNTLVNLNEDYEKLQVDKEELLRIAKEVKEAGEEGKLMMTEAIESSAQAEEAVQRCLKKIEIEWREFLANPEKTLPSFILPESKTKAQQILIWICETQTSCDYSELVNKWKSRSDYRGEEDLIDNYLEKITKYLGVRDYLKEKESSNSSSLNITMH